MYWAIRNAITGLSNSPKAYLPDRALEAWEEAEQSLSDEMYSADPCGAHVSIAGCHSRSGRYLISDPFESHSRAKRAWLCHRRQVSSHGKICIAALPCCIYAVPSEVSMYVVILAEKGK